MAMLCPLGRLLLALLVIVAAVPVSVATAGDASLFAAVVPMDLDRLVAESDHVFIGLVTAARARRDGPRIVTEVAVTPQEFFKSTTYAPAFTLVLPGGTVDGVTVRVEDVPRLSPGDRVLLFLKERAAGIAIVGGEQGVYHVRGGDAVQAASGATVPLADLRTRIRGLVRVPPPAYGGAMMIHQTTEEVTRAADLAVVAFVDDVRSRFTADGRSIETEVTLQVERTLKGATGDRLTLVLPGGTVGDLTVMVGGVPSFWPGERTLLFLQHGRARLGIAGLWQGKFSLVGELAIQPETGLGFRLADVEQRVFQALATPDVVRDDLEPVVAEAPFTIFCAAWTTAQVPVPYFVNPSSPGLGAPSGKAFVQLVQEANQAWQDIPNAWFSARLAGTTVRDGQVNGDGFSDVAWADLNALGFPTGVLGVNTCTGGFTRNDSDILLNNNGITWSTTASPGTIDLDSVVRHELGHGLGLGHSNVACDGGPSTPLMCPAIASGVNKTVLADDTNGTVSRYPLVGGPPGAPLAPAGAGTPNSAVLSWTPADSAALAFEIQRAAGSCAGPFPAVNTVPGSATSFTDDDYGFGLAIGTYCYRIKALGQGGDSGLSSTVLVTVGSNPVPTLSAVTPNVVGAGGPAFTLTVTGTGFVSASVVRWNGSNRVTTFGSATQLQAAINAADIAAVGSAQVTVFSPTPGGGTSNALTVTIAPVLRVVLAGAGPGKVVSSPGGLDCGTDCQEAYPAGTPVTLYPNPGLGGLFASWAGVGGCATTAPCTVTVNANVTVTATFGLAPPGFFTLQVTKQGDGTGTVGTNPAAVACGFLCSATLPGGTALTVTATPDPGARFTGWSGGGCSGTDPCDVTLNAHTPITATFIQSAIVTGTGTGGGAHVRGFTATGAASPLSFLVYPAGFTGGARVAVGDVNGDGGPDLITAAGTGGAPHVRVFSAMQPSAVLGEFFAYDLGYTGGLFIAAGDLDGDGKAEIVTGVGPGGGPHVRAFTRDPGGAFVEVRSFFAYAPEFSGGISVAACDVNGDGRADIITGAGPGGGPHVQVFSGATGASIASFFPYDTGLTAGIFVACGDVDGDGRADIVTGVGAGGGPHVTVTRVNGDGTLTTLASFFAYDPGARVGMRVATADLDGDGRAEILTAPGTGGGPHVKGFRRNPDGSVTEAASFFAYDPGFLGGVFVGGTP